ncbi:Membrane protein TMS1 [[Candida] zeylanoides]
MGAAISLPLMPVTSLASCCGAAACSALCSSVGGTFQSSVMTRVAYAFLLLVNCLMSWVVMSPFVVRKLERLTFGYINDRCGAGDQCMSFASVHRLNLALGTLHLLLALVLAGVRSTSNPRAVIQNGCWRLKLLGWLALVVVNFGFVPDGFFVFYGNHLAVVFSTVFLGIGLILLVDFAHAWAEKCLEKIELEELNGEESASFWKRLLVGGTLAMYGGAAAMTAVMYWFFAGSGCHMNRAAVSVNVVLAVVISLLSVNQTVQESNPHAGLAQTSMVVFYCTYLVMSAVASEPDDRLCNPLVRSRGTRAASVVLGAFFTFLAIAYTTTRAAGNSALFDGDEVEAAAQGYISGQPTSRREMRYQAIKQAVDEGSLPESALSQLDLYDEDEPARAAGDESTAVKYNYTLFHVIFFLATQYVATLLTINVQKDDLGDFAPVGRTYFMSWVKIVSSWVCFALYGWSLLAPVVLPDRFGVQI